MKKIILTLFLALSCAAGAYAQGNITVIGSVVDTSGEPVIGAGVTVAGTTNGVVTDAAGTFRITVPTHAQITVQSLGFREETVHVNGRTRIDFVLEEEGLALDELVVVGYGTMKQKELTSAVSHVNSKDFMNISTLDAGMLLQGKVAGVTVENVGVADPNQQATIQIRGVSSRNAGMDPLIVINGIPGGNLTNINPEDIASIDVLKDGAASAIYGTRASNGVILVNLKQGSKDGTIHSSYSFAYTLNVPKEELDLLSTRQFVAYRTYNNAFLNKGGDTDWFKAATRTGTVLKHTLSLSGGNAKTNYRVSADYRNATGIDLRSDRQEWGARANINHTTKGGLLTFSFNLAPRSIDRNKSDWGWFSSILSNNPTMNVKDASGNYTDFYGLPGDNVVEKMELVENGSEIKLLEWDGSVHVNLLPLLAPAHKGYSLTSKLTYAETRNNRLDYSFSPSTYSVNIRNGYAGQASQTSTITRNRSLDWVTNFSASFGGGHNIAAMAGYSYSYGSTSFLEGSNKDFQSDGLKYNALGSGEWLMSELGRTGVDSGKSDHTLIGFFARVNYNYKEKYLFSASLRHEGSSRFGHNHKWGNFPAVSVGWRISSEPFMKNLRFIDDLKFRYDFGVTGNEDIGNYMSLATYKSFGQYLYDGISFKVWGPSGDVNPDLRWEKGYNQNVGVDFSLFGHRLSGSINWFRRKQVDLLGSYDVPVPPTLDGTIYANVGTLLNTGLEVELSADVLRRGDWSDRITLTASTMNNKFISFSNDIYQGEDYEWMCKMSNPNNPGYLQKLEVGKRIGNYCTFRYAGVDEDGDWLIYNAAGEVIPVAQGAEEDKVITGNGLPKFNLSLSNTFAWKNLDFSFSLRGAFGFEIFDVHDFYFGLQSMEGNVMKYAYSKNAAITSGKNVIIDYFIHRGDYLKIDAASLGYTFHIDRKYLDKIRLYITGNNLWTFTTFPGVDPSTYPVNGLTPGTYGGDYSYYPSTYQIIMGVQVSF